MDSSVNAPEPSALPTALHPDAADRSLRSVSIIRKKRLYVKKKLPLFSAFYYPGNIHNRKRRCISWVANGEGGTT